MRYIDIENWERKEHFNFFRQLDYPHFNLCANVDITKFYKYIKSEGYPFFLSTLYAASKTANNIKEFRYRIREDKVVEHDTVHPYFTIMAENEVFSFCSAKFTECFGDFIINASNEIEKTKKHVCLEDEPGLDDCLYFTCIPWVSFTNITHPVHMSPVDSIPRISWGKYFEENGRIKLPLSVQAHHALVDGLHAGKYFEAIQEIFDNPEALLRG